MSDSTKKTSTELVRTDAPHFSDKEWAELNEYLQGKRGKVYNISEKVANNFLTLYLAGRSVTEIQESFPEWPQGAILHAAFHYKWHIKKQEHLSRLIVQSKERLPAVQMEIVNHALDRLTVAHAQFRKEMEKYLQNPTPDNLPKNCIRSTNEYKQVLEIIEKAISLGKQPNASDSQQGTTLNLNITTDPKPEIKVTPVEGEEKAKEIVDAEHSEAKELQPEEETIINGSSITPKEHAAILKALVNNKERNKLTSITYNEKTMSMYDLMLTPCQTPDTLHDWIIAFFGLDMPDCTVCDRSTSSPMNMIWNVYRAARDGLAEESSQLYFASRDSYKTLSAAIVEVLVMIHFRRTASHMGAIKQQSKKCYDYFKRFMSMSHLKEIKQLSDTQERTELDLPNQWNMNPYLQIVICTMAGANSEHTHFMCVDQDTKVMLWNGAKCFIKNLKLGAKVLTWDPNTQKTTAKPVIRKWHSGEKEAYKVTFVDGSSVVSSIDHEFYISGRGFIPLKEVSVGDYGVSKHRTRNPKPPKKELQRNTKNFPSQNIFDQVLLGSMLGGGGVYKKSQNNAYYKEQHCLEQKAYLEWKRSIIGTKCNTRPLKNAKSGFTGRKQVGFASGCNPIFNKYAQFKQTLLGIERLGPLGLAVWYMDDGCVGSGLKISSESFSKKQNVQLSDMLHKNFGIQTKVLQYAKTSSGKIYYYLRGDKQAALLLYETCKEWIHPFFRYKFKDDDHFYPRCLGCGKRFSPRTKLIKYCNDALCVSLASGLLKKNRIVSIRHIGKRQMYDITIKDTHNFFANERILLSNCVDEIDVVKNVQAYREAKKIPSETPDKKPSITLYISTRKSPFGLVQYEVDNAKKSGLKVRSWNIIDVGQPCPADKSRIEEGTVKRYYKENDLMIHSKETMLALSPADASECEEVELYNGCLSCAIAPLCLGRLATKQTGSSLLLKSHADIEKKFRESEIDDALAQLMCYKPSLHGLVFSRLNEQASFMNITQMWEKVTGEVAKKEITKQELIDTFHKHNIPAYAGIDWGWNTSVCLVAFIDSRENIYVVHELSMNHVDDPDFIDTVKNKIHPIYKVQMYFPDTENPSGINLMKKENLPVSSKVEKGIHLGVQTIKRYMKIPGLGTTKFFMLDEECPGLVQEFRKYHLLLDAAGQIVSHDKYADEFNHRIDALRYIITNTLARMTATFDFMDLPSYTGKKTGLKNQDGNFQKVPTAEELAEHMGRTDFQDNRDDPDKDPKDGKGGGGSFSWSM